MVEINRMKYSYDGVIWREDKSFHSCYNSQVANGTWVWFLTMPIFLLCHNALILNVIGKLECQEIGHLCSLPALFFYFQFFNQTNQNFSLHQ